MKLTKGEFKVMIKECIKELIKEGAFNQALHEAGIGKLATKPSSGLVPKGVNQPASSKSVKDPMLAERAKMAARRIAGFEDEIDSMVPDSFAEGDEGTMQETKMINPGLQNLVEGTARMMAKGDNRLAESYAAIFADTAMHTLPKMMMNDPNRQGYGNLAAAGMQANVEKVKSEELQMLAPTGDVTRWATLAFGTNPTGKR